MRNKRELTITINGITVYRHTSYIATEPTGIMDFPGVYLIRDAVTDALVYVGTGHNVCQRFKGKHHIYDPEKHIIEVIHTEDDNTRIWLEAILVSTLQPPGNARKRVRLGECGGLLTESPSSGYTKPEPEQLTLIDSRPSYAVGSISRSN